MSKKILFSIFVLLFISRIHAQITITAGDVQTIFPIGTQYLSHADTVTKSINIGGTGNFGTVNFSSVKSNVSYLTTSVSVASTPYAADYPEAQFAFKNNQAYNGGTAENYVYTSFTDSYYLYGTATAATIGGMNSIIKLKFNPAQQFYKFPITYNSTFSQSTSQIIGTSFTDFPIPPVSTTQAWSMTQTVDGYGTMITPDGKTLSCLRVKDEITVNTQAGPVASISYAFITKTGESVSVSPAQGQPNNGTVQVTAISWSEGFGTSDPSEVEKTNELPTSYSLSQNYPNPFNPSTKISFSLPQTSFVKLSIYDALGRELTNLLNQNMNAGSYSVDFNAADFPSGIYLYKISANGFIQTKKMILIK